MYTNPDNVANVCCMNLKGVRQVREMEKKQYIVYWELIFTTTTTVYVPIEILIKERNVLSQHFVIIVIIIIIFFRHTYKWTQPRKYILKGNWNTSYAS